MVLNIGLIIRLPYDTMVQTQFLFVLRVFI